MEDSGGSMEGSMGLGIRTSPAVLSRGFDVLSPCGLSRRLSSGRSNEGVRVLCDQSPEMDGIYGEGRN